MRIATFLLAGFVFLFSNIDNLIGDFESEYTKAEKKMPKSRTFNKNMVTQKETYKNNMNKMGSMDKMSNMGSMDKMSSMGSMHKMDKMSSVQHAIKNQQNMNNKEDMLKVINKEIEAYLDSLIPLISMISLFAFLALMMYITASAMSISVLKHKVSVLEKFVPSKIKSIERDSAKKHSALARDIKKLALKLASTDTMIQKILRNDRMSESDNSKKTIDNKKVKTKTTPTDKEMDDAFDADEFMLDDNFAMDDSDEGLNLDNTTKSKKENTAPLSNLSSLDMDIDTKSTSKKNKQANIKEMEEFSLDDFDE